MKNFDFQGLRVLITGGTSGLGKALAEALALRGAQVVIVARHTAPEPMRGVHFIQADVSKKSDTYRISAEAIAHLGGVDLLINNASALGATPLRLLMDTDCEDLQHVLETNLIGAFRLTKAILPGMVLRKSGTVLNISSDAAVNPYPRWGSYGASKAALAHLSRIWGEELKDQGVHFIAVDPGDMNTPMHAAAIPDADVSQLNDPRDVALRLLEVIHASRTI